MSDAIISAEVVEATIASFTKLDTQANERAMNRLARRLGKEQPAMLRYAARYRDEHGETVGEAMVFYATLVWAIFDRGIRGTLPQITEANLETAREEVEAALAAIEGLADKPVHERYSPALAERQPNIHAKLAELVAEDVREDAMDASVAARVYTPAQVVVEAMDAAITGRRPGERQGPTLRKTPKVGRNEPCPCGSGKKYKKCCGR